MYLHELGDEAASFTKEEMQVSTFVYTADQSVQKKAFVLSYIDIVRLLCVNCF